MDKSNLRNLTLLISIAFVFLFIKDASAVPSFARQCHCIFL